MISGFQVPVPATGVSKAVAALSRGERIIAFIERFCLIPSGDLVGKPMRLEEFQKKFILDVYDNPYGTSRAYLSLARKNGKGLALDTPIPTPSGWKKMGELKPGDKVFDENGQPCSVTYVSPVHIGLRCWRLKFSDGSEIVADEEHQWLTIHRVPGKGRAPRIVKTPDIAESVFNKRSDGKVSFNHGIPVSKALKTSDTSLLLDPYLLGCWLGDGNSRSGRLSCGDQDLEFFVRAVGDGLNLTPAVRCGRTAWGIRLSAGRGGPKASKFQSKLRELGILGRGNKRIPHVYLWSGTEQRRALLQGLMDTDGHSGFTGKSGAVSCSITLANELLAQDVLTLVRSLGIKATIKLRKTRCGNNGKLGIAHRVQFTAYQEDRPFRLDRKMEKLKPTPITRRRAATLKIEVCDPVPSVPTKCIQVDSQSSLFLAGSGMVATHNTALIACLVLAHLCGPEARLNTQLISGARSRDQAALVFDLASKMVQMSPILSKLVRVVPSGKRLIGLKFNTEYKAISAEGKTALGLSPYVAILDEVGQVQGPRDSFVSAITSSQGAYRDALLIAISTQAPTDNDLFSIWLDSQKNAPDPRVISHVYAASEDAALDDRAGWIAANPALGKFKAIEDLEKESRLAIEMPSYEPDFRNFSLNQRVESTTPFVTRNIWNANSATPDPLDDKEVFGGLDLSAVADLTALVLGTTDGDIHCTFWLPKHGLIEKSKKDHVPYDLWEKEGHLLTVPGRAIEYEYIAEYLRGVFDRYNIQKIAFDRYNFNFLRPWLVEKDFTDEELEKFVPFGQGTVSMTPALRELETKLLNAKLKHGDNPILKMCAANARVMGPSHARKFDKMKSRGRIDGMQSLAMCVGVMPSIVDEPEYQTLYLGKPGAKPTDTDEANG